VSAETITNTGPNSNNTITNNSTQNSSTVCINTTTVSNTNNQGATSGSANNSGNTSSGGATSGSSSNTSSTNTSVNSGCPGGTKAVPAGSAEAKAAGGGVAPNGARVDAQGRVLPATGIDGTLKIAAIAVAGFAAAAGVLQFATKSVRARAIS
jgi:hypothetical protein